MGLFDSLLGRHPFIQSEDAKAEIERLLGSAQGRLTAFMGTGNVQNPQPKWQALKPNMRTKVQVAFNRLLNKVKQLRSLLVSAEQRKEQAAQAQGDAKTQAMNLAKVEVKQAYDTIDQMGIDRAEIENLLGTARAKQLWQEIEAAVKSLKKYLGRV